MIVLDASVLIAFLDARDAHHTAAEELLARVVGDELAASSLTLAEVLVGPVRDERLGEVEVVLRDLEIRELPFPSDAAMRLAGLRVSTGMKLSDCCVLLAAEEASDSVATFDERLSRAAEERGLSVLPG